MFLKDILDKKIAINCRTEEEAMRLCKYAEEKGYDNYERYSNRKTCYSELLQDTCYSYTTQFDKKGALEYGDKCDFISHGYKIITLDDLDDFKQTKEVWTKKYGNLEDNFENSDLAKSITSITVDEKEIIKQINRMKLNMKNDFFQIPIPYELFFTINREKKTLFLQYNDKKITIKCHETDKFDWKIGLGLALSKVNAIDNKRAYFLRDIMRNSKTHKLDYKKYSNFVLNEYFNYDSNEIKRLDKKVSETDDNIKIYL